MKLRLQTNTLRLRLKRGEVEQLLRSGRVEEVITLGERKEDALTYTLESSTEALSLQVKLIGQKIRVVVPAKTATAWALGDEVGIEDKIPTGGDKVLLVLIEKDFACLNGTDEQNRDTFPNPLAGTKC